MSKWILKIGGVVVVLILVGAVVAAANYAKRSQELAAQLDELSNDPQVAAQDEIDRLKEEVGKLIDLPNEEQPTLATITDKDKLKENTFFSKAENGDKVLIYVNARRAYLYRPSASKLVEVASVNLNTETGETGESSPEVAGASDDDAEPISARLLNGTVVTGLTQVIESELENVEVVGRANAVNKYKETIVVDTGAGASLTRAVATQIGAKVGDLPAGETKPNDAEVLIIVGEDKAESGAAG